MKYYIYGMRLRGFSPFCQPMDGLVRVYEPEDFNLPKYWRMFHNILKYNRQLTETEIRDYELDYLFCIED